MLSDFMTGSSEAEVTGVEVLAEKIACSLVLKGLYTWWLQRLVYSPLVSEEALPIGPFESFELDLLLGSFLFG